MHVDHNGESPQDLGDEALVAEMEEAQGVEVFVSPEAIVPGESLQEGAPGHEALVADQAGLGPDAEDDTPDSAAGESYDG
ncbi:MAG: hypothetical protein OES13_02520 [Acidimicrobiia bacterium]|nr:hypothetical protein [Acidimicrobiia bacterium]